MTTWLPAVNLILNCLILGLGWVWASGRWAKGQEVDTHQLAKDLVALEKNIRGDLEQFEARLDRAGEKMSDLSGELQVFAELAYRVKALEEGCHDLPALREELITMRTVLRLRKRNGSSK